MKTLNDDYQGDDYQGDNDPADHYLADYYLSQDGLFLIPVEHLSREGISAELRALLVARGVVGEGWINLFEQAYALYWQRLQELHTAASGEWFPPRVQHVCIVTDSRRVRPFFQPFHQSAWLLYASDFDPRVSNAEFAAFQLIQVERMGVLQQVVSAMGANLGYWLLRSDDEVAAFNDACAHNPRPDIHAYRALAKAMPWVRRVYHARIKPAPAALKERLMAVPGTDFLLPRQRLVDMERLARSCTRAMQGVAEAYYKQYHQPAADPAHVDALCRWLAQQQPRLLISGKAGHLLWDCEQPQAVERLRTELNGISAAVADSLRADWEVVGRHSQAFVEQLADLERLPRPKAHYADQNGLSYMHIQRREVTYNVHEAGMQRLREPAPAFERLMLGARTIHEWGHLFVDGGGVPVAPQRQAEYHGLRDECSALYTTIIAAAPEAVRRNARVSLQGLVHGQEDVGQALTRLTLARMEDFQANLMARRFLSPWEMETYVRNNHRSHVHDYPRVAYFQRLARYAYEYQYLRFSAMPDAWSFFMKTTWFKEQYLDSQVVSLAHTRQLFALVGRICDCYQVDESGFKP